MASGRTRRWAALAGIVTSLTGCGPRAVSPQRSIADLEPSWEDAFDRPPPVLLSLRPKALRRDPVYGPLLDKVLALARAKSHVVDATRALEVVEDADQVILGLRGDPGESDEEDTSAEIVASVLGVRAEVDPASIVDSSGHALWTAGSGGRVPELVREHDEDGHAVGASLFELPGRAWVMAAGPARLRLRDFWSRPHPHPRPLDLPDGDHAVVYARLDGRFLVARLRWLRSPAALAPVGRDLTSVALTLAPGGTVVSASFAYSDEPSAGAAERTLDDAVAALARERPEGLAWLGEARVSRSVLPGAESVVDVAAPIPTRLIDVLVGKAEKSGKGAKGGAPPTGADDAGAAR
jgi:hypothetical protein